MPQPLPSQMHTDKFLTNMSVAFYQEATQFVAGRVFPIIGVQKQSDLYPVFPKSRPIRTGVKSTPSHTRSMIVSGPTPMIR